MNDQNRMMKWLFVIGLVVLSLMVLYPPREKLKGGIDLVGGTSMLFEIDTSGLEIRDQRNLSTKVMDVLKERVDPKGQLNLEWRPVGNTRLEIRMPRPPKEALERRDRYNQSLEQLASLNISRFDVESSLNVLEDHQAEALAAIVRGVKEREPLVKEVESAYTAYVKAQAAEEEPATAASSAYEEAMSKLLATSMPTNRLTDILALPSGKKREEQLSKLRGEFPSYDAPDPIAGHGKLLTRTVQAYDAWAKDKADLEDPSDLKRRIRGAGVLEFRILADRDSSSPGNTTQPVQPVSRYTEQLAKRGPRPKSGDRYRWFPVDDILRFTRSSNIEEFQTAKDLPGRPIIEEYAGRYFVLMHNDPSYGLLQGSSRGKRWSLTQAYPDRDPMTGENTVNFTLDPRGGQLFGELTGSNIQRELCIMLDGEAMSFATIQSRITTRCRITGRFTTERVQNLVRILDAGSLPARLKETPLSEQTIGPSLGETNRRKGLTAAAWAMGAVVFFMLIYYGLAGGGMADVALAMNLLFVLAAMAMMQATFTLPGIAGLILTVGMAVDANVLIFERFREERDRGLVFKKALNAGYDKALSTILDANITTLITCVILGFVGSEEVKGFAIVLGIGITTSMFTSLFVTRLVYNTLIAKGLLKDLSMRRIIGKPVIEWLRKWRVFVPLSVSAVTLGLGLFVGLTSVNKEAVFDIEFLGGTSVQIDLKTHVAINDEKMTHIITAPEGDSVVRWLNRAADQLKAANVAGGETPGQFQLTSHELGGDQMAVLMRHAITDQIDRDGIQVTGRTVSFFGKPGRLDEARFEAARMRAVAEVRTAANRLRGARVQSVSETGTKKDVGLSYEIVTIETNRELVQEAILAVLGDKLNVQRAINFRTVRDEELTREPFFVVEANDHYLSDVLGGDSPFDVRRFRGGVAIEVALDEDEPPITVAELDKRIREVGLQPDFEQFRTLDSAIFPLGRAVKQTDRESVYHQFAVLAIDDTLLYEDDPVQWTDLIARTKLAQVEAALGSEKSLSKVVAFAPQIAVQTKNRAVFAAVLAFAAIVAYLWIRFGSKEYGLAAIVCLVHDVTITLGLIALSHFLYDTFIGHALLLSDFKIDLPMIAALLTVVGYSLNDTIVVFDRIRENRGRVTALSAKLIDNSINQTLSRTLLTSFTTAMVVLILYTFGGTGIHGFSFALLSGVVVGTYSSIAVAAPLLYKPAVLRSVVIVIVSLALIGIVDVEIDNATTDWILTGVITAGGLYALLRGRGGATYSRAPEPARG